MSQLKGAVGLTGPLGDVAKKYNLGLCRDKARTMNAEGCSLLVLCGYVAMVT